MNNTKNPIVIIALTVVISLWLLFLGYSVFCLLAYMIGWYPFIGALIFSLLSLLFSILIFVQNRKKGGQHNSLLYAAMAALFISGIANTIILGAKFQDYTYRGAVIKNSYSSGYLYNILGYKIIDVEGHYQFEDDYIYLCTMKRVYQFDYDGDYIDDKEWVLREDRSWMVESEYDVKFIEQPYTKKGYLSSDRQIYYDKYYDYVDDIGIDEDNYFYWECSQENKRCDIIRATKWGFRVVQRDCYVDSDNDRFTDSKGRYSFFIVKNKEDKIYFIETDGSKISTPNRYYEDSYFRCLGHGQNGKVYIDAGVGNDKRDVFYIDKYYHSDNILTSIYYVEDEYSEYDDYDKQYYLRYIQYRKSRDGRYYLYDIKTGQEKSAPKKIRQEYDTKKFYYPGWDYENIYL